MYTKKCSKWLKIMSLPPPDHNLFLHILRAHLQTIPAKWADQEDPPELDITKYGWKIKDGTPGPTASNQPPESQELMDVVWCSCKAVMKVCHTARCSCHHGKMSCTVYCSCEYRDACFNPFRQGRKTKMNRLNKDKKIWMMIKKLDILIMFWVLMMNGSNQC